MPRFVPWPVACDWSLKHQNQGCTNEGMLSFFMADHIVLCSICQLVELNDHLEVFLSYIWTYKAVGHTKFKEVFHENDASHKITLILYIRFLSQPAFLFQKIPSRSMNIPSLQQQWHYLRLQCN